MKDIILLKKTDSTYVYTLENGLECIIITDLNELEEYRKTWFSLSKHIYSDWDYNYNSIKYSKSIQKPYTIIIKKESKIISIIAGYIQNSKITLLKVGYFPILKLKVRKIIVPIGCVMGNLSNIDIKALYSIIRTSLKQFNSDMIFFNYLNIKNYIYTNYSPFLLESKQRRIEIIKHYKVDLTKDRNLFLKKLNKYRRRSKTPDKFSFRSVNIRCYNKEKQFESFVDTAYSISQKSFKSNIGHSFIYTPEKKVMYKKASEQKRLFCYTLDIEDRPCAFLVMLIYKGTCYFDQSGYNYLYRYCSPGSYLLIKAMDDIIGDHRVKEIDFGPGEISFKERLSDDFEEVTHLIIYSNSLKALIIKIFTYYISMIKRIKNIGLHVKIKNNYKKRIIQKLTDEELQH